jgi:pyridoxine 4-dehydrogenase
MYKTPVETTFELGGDLTVCRMGFGARWVCRHGPDAARALLRRAVELGVNLIDTADVYGADHASELLIADALHPYPDDLVIATKGGQVAGGDGPAADGRPEYLRAACEASLMRLRVDTIPLYQLHMPDPDVPLEESIGALMELRAEGKVRHIGISNVFRGDLERVLDLAPIASVQNLYNLGRRGSDYEVDVCARRELGYMPWLPLFAGELPGDGVLGEVAAAHGASASQVALAWLLARSPTMLPIPGTSRIEHLEENLGALDIQLSEAEVDLLASYSSE